MLELYLLQMRNRFQILWDFQEHLDQIEHFEIDFVKVDRFLIDFDQNEAYQVR